MDSEEYIKHSDELEYGSYTNLLNVFMVYYKRLFQKDHKTTMFHDIDYDKENSTNRGMELFYDELMKYNSKKSNEDLVAIYDFDEMEGDNCVELYKLTIHKGDQMVEYGCQFLIPLISFLSENSWTKVEWFIERIKSDG